MRVRLVCRELLDAVGADITTKAIKLEEYDWLAGCNGVVDKVVDEVVDKVVDEVVDDVVDDVVDEVVDDVVDDFIDDFIDDFVDEVVDEVVDDVGAMVVVGVELRIDPIDEVCTMMVVFME